MSENEKWTHLIVENLDFSKFDYKNNRLLYLFNGWEIKNEITFKTYFKIAKNDVRLSLS